MSTQTNGTHQHARRDFHVMKFRYSNKRGWSWT